MAEGRESKVRREMAKARTRMQMVRTARRVLTGDECEDAAHDAIVQALLSEDRFRADAQVGTWLHRIAVNAALMQKRSASRAHARLHRVQREADALPELALVGVAPRTRDLEEREQRQALRDAVAQLPDGYRAVVERCVYDEQDADTVAADLGISASALRTRIMRARDRLRALLGVAPAAFAEAA